MQLLNTREYYNDLQKTFAEANHRIVVTAMLVTKDPTTTPLLEELLAAAKRGVQVAIVVDVFTKFHENSQRWQETLAFFTLLESAGAKIVIIGKLGLHPYAGRCHIKATIVDNTVYSFGGVNFDRTAFGFADYMLKTHQMQLADELYALIDLLGTPRLPDHKTSLSHHHTLLFDGGRPGKSIIYETACRLARHARNIYYVSQMCPSGELAKIFAAKNTACYFNRVAQTGFPGNFALAFDQQRFGITNLYNHQTYIHAKFILFENADGSRELLSGSHNFSWRGVAYGTKEIALHSTDPDLWHQLYSFYAHNML